MANNERDNDQRGGSGNFASDPQRASEAGRKGGQHNAQQGGPSQGGQQSQTGADQGQQGGGNFSQNPERAAEAGRKGGQNVPDEKRSFSQDPDLASDAGRKGGQR